MILEEKRKEFTELVVINFQYFSLIIGFFWYHNDIFI